MKLQKFAARSAGFFCALLTAACTAVSAGAIWDDVILYDDDTPKKETIKCGDYEYTRMIGVEDETKKAACIEKYNGTETEVVIPSELDGLEVVVLGDSAFADNHDITAVTIPASVIGLGNYTFAECTAIREFRVEEGNPYCVSKDGVLYTTDGTGLLHYPIAALGDELTIEEGITSIGNAAFAGAHGLKSVTLPSTLETLGICSFAECSSLTRILIPSKVTAIPDFCFNGCSDLMSVTLPDGLVSIGHAAFVNAGLISLTLPETLQTIGQQAFANTKLMSVTIPKSVMEIGTAAFGWKVNGLNELAIDKNFTIRGYQGSQAEKYASDYDEGNNFKFEAVSEQAQPEQTTASAPQDKKPSKAGKIIALIVCGILLALTAAAAVFSELRRKKAAEEAARMAKKKKKKQAKSSAAEKAAAEETPAALTADEAQPSNEGSETD